MPSPDFQLRLRAILASAEAVFKGADDLRRDNVAKIATSREQWRQLIADADFACTPDTRDDSRLRQLISAVRRAVRSLNVSAAGRFLPQKLPSFIIAKRQAEFSERIVRLQIAVKSLSEMGDEDESTQA